MAETFSEYKKELFSEDLLVYLLVAGAVTISVVNPMLLTPAILFAKYGEKNADKKRFKNSFYYLRTKKLINIEVTGKNSKITLTKKGKKKAVDKYINNYQKIKISQKGRWDGVWYLVIFDIEDGKKVKRDALRRALNRNGFYLLQKSVWISPYKCVKEISLIKDFFDLNDDECRIIIAKEIGDEKKVKKFFNL